MTNSPSERPGPAAQGRLSKTPVVNLLLYAHDRKLNGTIELAAPGATASILFIDGQPAKVRTSEPVMYLGRVLLELGFINDARLNSSLLEMSRTRRLHGRILIDEGAITDDQLMRALEEQLRRKLHHIFTFPSDTTFAYYDSFDALHAYGGDEIVAADPLPLVWAAIREAPPWEHVSAALTRVATTPLRMSRKAEIERFGFDARELQLVELLRARPMKVSELAALEILRPRDAQLLAYCLVVTKQVSVVQERASMPPPPLSAGGESAGRVPVSAPAGVNPVSFAMRAADARASVAPPLPPPSTRSLASAAPISSRTPSSSRAPIAPAVASPAPPQSPTPPPPFVVQTPSPPTPSPGLSEAQLAQLEPEMRARRDEILERAKYIDREDYFQMLDVSREATPDEVKSAFFKLAKLWHPDRLPIAISDVRDACSRVFGRMGEAHATLTDAKKRENYMKLISEGGATPEAQATIAAVVEAATAFQKAEVFMKRNDFVQAEQMARKASEGDPEQPDYIALLAWLEALKPENQSQAATLAAIGKLGKAIKISEKCERAYFYRGLLFKRSGEHHLAVRDFRKAAELNPRNIDAVREVRLHEMRSQKGSLPPPSTRKKSDPPNRRGSASPPKRPEPEKSGGIFGKLFKK